MSDLPRLLLCVFDVVPAPTALSRRVTEYLKGLSERYQVVVLSVKTPDHTHIERYHGARLLRVPVGNGDLAARVQAFDRAVRRQMESEEYVVVHSFDPFGGYALAERRGEFGYKLVYDACSLPSVDLPFLYSEEEVNRRFIAKVRRQELFCLMNADAVITANELTRDFVTQLGVAREQVQVLPAPVDLAPYEPDVMGLPDATPMKLLHLGHQGDAQDLSTLLEAMQLALQTTDVRLAIVGPKSERHQARLEEQVADLKLSGKVEFQPPVAHDDLHKVLATVDVGLLTLSDVERNSRVGSPLARLAEYLAAGRPVIAADVPSARAVLPEDGVVLYRSQDAVSLADAIVSLATEPARRVKLGAAARAAALDRDAAKVRADLTAIYVTLSGAGVRKVGDEEATSADEPTQLGQGLSTEEDTQKRKKKRGDRETPSSSGTGRVTTDPNIPADETSPEAALSGRPAIMGTPLRDDAAPRTTEPNAQRPEPPVVMGSPVRSDTAPLPPADAEPPVIHDVAESPPSRAELEVVPGVELAPAATDDDAAPPVVAGGLLHEPDDAPPSVIVDHEVIHALPVSDEPMVSKPAENAGPREASTADRHGDDDAAPRADQTPVAEDALPPIKRDVPPLAVENALPPIKRDVPPAAENALPPLKRDVPPSAENALPPIKRDVPPLAVENALPPIKRDAPPAAENALPPLKRDMPPAAENALPPLKRDVPPGAENTLPPIKRDVPPAAENALPPLKRDVPPAAENALPSLKRDVPPLAAGTALPPIKRDVPPAADTALPPIKREVPPGRAPTGEFVAPPLKRDTPRSMEGMPPVLSTTGDFPVAPAGPLPPLRRDTPRGTSAVSSRAPEPPALSPASGTAQPPTLNFVAPVMDSAPVAAPDDTGEDAPFVDDADLAAVHTPARGVSAATPEPPADEPELVDDSELSPVGATPAKGVTAAATAPRFVPPLARTPSGIFAAASMPPPLPRTPSGVFATVPPLPRTPSGVFPTASAPRPPTPRMTPPVLPTHRGAAPPPLPRSSASGVFAVPPPMASGPSAIVMPAGSGLFPEPPQVPPKPPFESSPTLLEPSPAESLIEEMADELVQAAEVDVGPPPSVIDAWFAMLVHGYCPPASNLFARHTPPTTMPGRDS